MTMKLAVVVVRNLGARWLGAYGNEWVATPHLDRLAAEGIVFERHIADRIDGQSDSYAGPVVRFDDLVPPWDVPVEIFETYAEEYGPLTPVREPGPIAADDLAAWDALRCSYAAVLTRLDAKLGKRFAELAEGAIVVTSDRGFPLGEHGVVGPAGSRAHAELVHLPLIVWRPGNEAARVDGFTQPGRFFEAVGCLHDESDEGTKKIVDERAFLPAVRATVQTEAITKVATGRVDAIRTADWTCLPSNAGELGVGTCARLYRMPEDGGECHDQADRRPEIVDELIARFDPGDDYSNTND